jgi:hypothetical protein
MVLGHGPPTGLYDASVRRRFKAMMGDDVATGGAMVEGGMTGERPLGAPSGQRTAHPPPRARAEAPARRSQGL